MTRLQRFRAFIAWMKTLREGLQPFADIDPIPPISRHASALGRAGGRATADRAKEKQRQTHRRLAAAVGRDWAW